MSTFLLIMMGLMAAFLILLVLLQRGRGGGLAGALGGAGGQSAFGTRAGDMFTRITIVVAFVWILLCIVTTKYISSSNPLTAGTQDGVNATGDTGTGDAGTGDGGAGAENPAGDGN